MPELKKVLQAATAPLTTIGSRTGKAVGDWISPSNQVGSPLRGFLSGAAEGLGGVIDDFTSPASIASSMIPGLSGARSLFRTGSQAAKGLNTAGRTMDIIEDIPVNQVAPSMSEVEMMIGDMSRNLARVPSRGERVIPQGINPASLPPSLVPRGSESIYNSARSAPSSGRSLEDVAYEIVRSGNDPARRSISGGVDLATMMANASRARGR